MFGSIIHLLSKPALLNSLGLPDRLATTKLRFGTTLLGAYCSTNLALFVERGNDSDLFPQPGYPSAQGMRDALRISLRVGWPAED
jgi:hypothetical protein